MFEFWRGGREFEFRRSGSESLSSIKAVEGVCVLANRRCILV